MAQTVPAAGDIGGQVIATIQVVFNAVFSLLRDNMAWIVGMFVLSGITYGSGRIYRSRRGRPRRHSARPRRSYRSRRRRRRGR